MYAQGESLVPRDPCCADTGGGGNRPPSPPSLPSGTPLQNNFAFDGADQRGAGARARGPASEQFLLTPERQLTLDGREEPLAVHVDQVSAELELEHDARQWNLFQTPQAQLVLHPLIHASDCDGKEHDNCKVMPECVRSWFAAVCPHHASAEERRPRPQLCALQACESSKKANTIERARDAWDGTAEVQPRGLRHFGNAHLAIFEVTVPEELRSRCAGDRLRETRKAADELVLKILRCYVENEQALFWGRSWLHPEGDREPNVYKPHEHILVPLRWWDPIREKANRVSKCELSEQLLAEARGWWRDELVGIFGTWWTGPKAPEVNLHYHWVSDPKEKMHALSYCARTFPAWARHPKVPLRPRAFGLAHWKHGSELRATCALERLPAFDDCPECVAAGEEPPPRVPVFGATPEDVERQLPAALAVHTCATCRAPGAAPDPRPYLEYRRTMTAEIGLQRATGPPSTVGPGEEWVQPVTGEIIVEPLVPEKPAPMTESARVALELKDMALKSRHWRELDRRWQLIHARHSACCGPELNYLIRWKKMLAHERRFQREMGAAGAHV